MQHPTLPVANAILIDPKKMIRFSDAVAIVHERMAQITGLNAEPARLDDRQLNSECDVSKEQKNLGATYKESRVNFFVEKSLIIDWLCQEAIILFARKPLRAEDGGFADWKVPRISRTQYLKGLRILPLGSETNPTVRDLWHSEKYLDRKTFFELLNAALPMPKGAWTGAAEERAVKSLGEFLKAEPNSSKAACLKYLRAIYPSTPDKAFNNRIWGKSRSAAGLSEKGSSGRKPIREQSTPQ